jgi:hypothetical protein
MSIQCTNANNVVAVLGNGLCLFKDCNTGVLYLKDTNGKISPVQDNIDVFNRRLFSQIEDGEEIDNTTTETNLIGQGVGNLTILANQFQVGDSFNFMLGGVISDNGGSDTLRVRIKSLNGGSPVTLADSGNQDLPNLTNETFELNLNFTIRQIGSIGTASILTIGSMNFAKTSSGNLEGFEFRSLNNTTFYTTQNQTLSVTVQWGTANVNNKVQSLYGTLVKRY